MLWVCLLLCATWFSIFYFTTGYDTMKQWFLSLNDCFYRRGTWGESFFTPAIKAQGNVFAFAGAIIAPALIICIVLNRKRWMRAKAVVKGQPVTIAALKWYIAVIILALVAGACSYLLMEPSYDEIFSAVNCAELHPFQVIAYYMLPNNHMYFNLINHLLFSWCWGDLVSSGKLLSVIAYVGVLLCIYHWLHSLIRRHFISFLALLPVALQFTPWAMAGQARSYEAELLCGWGSVITMFCYFLKEEDKYLKINAFFTVAGFILMPAYLTIYTSQVFMFISVMIYLRKLNLHYIRYQFIAGAAIFLCYVPSLCFSGIGSFTDNPFVRPATEHAVDFLPVFWETLKYFIGFCFSMIGGDGSPVNYVLFLLPLILLFSKQKAHRILSIYYIILWLTYIAFTIYWQRNPFNRNMIIHYSLTMACVVYSLYVVIHQITNRLKKVKVQKYALYFLFALPVLSYSGYLAFCDKRDVSYQLYFYEVNELYRDHVKELALIPPGSSIGFSEEAFYQYYYFRKHHYNVVKCSTGTEAYFIKRKHDSFPPGTENSYIKIKDGIDNYEFYRKK